MSKHSKSPDFVVYSGSYVHMIEPLSERARDWCADNVGPVDHAVSCDQGMAFAIAHEMVDAGLRGRLAG